MQAYLDHLRAKSEHTRKFIAFGAAAGVTGLVAIVWGVSFASSNVLSLSTIPTFETPPPTVTASDVEQNFSGLAGAVNALQTGEEPNELVIVDGKVTSTIDENKGMDERTVIPF